MLTSHNTGGFATTSAPDGFGLDDFESAGLRAVERRFAPKDTIFTPATLTTSSTSSWYGAPVQDLRRLQGGDHGSPRMAASSAS